MPKDPSSRPHLDVADRFRFFLDAVGLSRDAFVSAVDGSIGARSLYSVLNGTRRPSRALGVLIERTWGFRAEFLFSGKTPMWTEAQALGPGVVALELSPAESGVLDFMRNSVENSRSLVGELSQLQTGSQVFERTLELVRELDTCGNSRLDEDVRIYPLLAKLVHDDCRFLADQYEQLIVLRHRRRVLKLTSTFLSHFVRDLPQETLGAPECERFRSMLEPILEHRRKKLIGLEQSIEGVRTTIVNLCSVGSLADRAREQAEDPRVAQHMGIVGRLADMAPHMKAEIESLLGRVTSDNDPKASYSKRLHRLLRDLLKEIDQEIPDIEALAVEELCTRYERLLDPLTAA